jgi:ribosomal protein L35
MRQGIYGRRKANESEADNNNSNENGLHEDPRRVGPSNFTRGQRPSGFSSVIKSHSTTPPKPLTPSQLQKIRKYDKALDNQTPSNMYPSGRLARSTTSDYETKWWLDDEVEEKPGVTPADDLLAKAQLKTHIFLRKEMKKLRAVRSSLLLAENHAKSQKGTLPPGLFIPAIYSDQELVNLSCLVDRGREFEVDTEYKSRNKFAIRVDLYQLDPKRKLKSYLKKGSKHPPSHPLMIAIYKDWLKLYLDWFDPDLFEYISAHAAGMKVLTFANRLASNYDHDYEMQAQIQYDPLLVPVPKMHKKVSTCDEFGVTEENVFQPKCKDKYARLPSHSRAGRQASYDKKLTATCNPSGFEYVPIARMPSSTVPDHLVQIKALYAQLSHSRGKRKLFVGWVYKVESMLLCQLSGSFSILIP